MRENAAYMTDTEERSTTIYRIQEENTQGIQDTYTHQGSRKTRDRHENTYKAQYIHMRDMSAGTEAMHTGKKGSSNAARHKKVCKRQNPKLFNQREGVREGCLLNGEGRDNEYSSLPSLLLSASCLPPPPPPPPSPPFCCLLLPPSCLPPVFSPSDEFSSTHLLPACPYLHFPFPRPSSCPAALPC